jgi:Ala-tRNA(Pro) deacylase
MPATREELFAFLDSLGIRHETTTHPPAFTVEDAKALRGQIPGGHTKNLFLKDKKGRLWLVVALEDTRVNLKTLHRKIGAARLSFGKPELLEDVLGVRPGSVTPFALINDREKRVSVVLDSRLMETDPLNFHPLENTATTTVSNAGFRRFLEATGHSFQIVDLEAEETKA